MKNFKFIISLFIFSVFLSLEVSCAEQDTGFENFITIRENKLIDGSQEFRFISFNIPNINFVEDEMAFTRKNAFRLPCSFEIRDALKSVKQIGGRVVRMYTIPVRRENDTKDIPRYVLAPGEFDDKAFLTMDTVLAISNEVGVRLIIPLVNSWKWMGGAPQYAEFRGKTKEDFWTDPELISDFKKTIKYVLSRKNTVSGIKYKDDKAILCWETGNELTCPHDWTVEIVKYIKSIDSNHLVMDGYYAIGQNPVREESVLEPLIDIVSSHHYETDPRELIENIDANLKIVKDRKPYIIGEFGFISTSGIRQVLSKVIKEEGIAGSLIWSLRYRRREGGFYWHSEPMGLGLYKAYHWVGFDSGEECDEKDLLDLMHEKAFEIQGKSIPDLTIPDAPKLLEFDDVSKITWQGSVGASSYDIQRSTSKNGPWETVGFDISDAGIQYYPLFNDERAKISEEYYYRVIAKNRARESVPSNIVGPLKVTHKTLIDNMNNYGTLYYFEGKIQIATSDDRKFKEDLYRMMGDAGSELIYRVPGKIIGWKVYSFSEENEQKLEFSQSTDGKNYKRISAEMESYYSGKGDYDYWCPILYKYESEDQNTQYLKIRFNKTIQIGRIEIYYVL